MILSFMAAGLLGMLLCYLYDTVPLLGASAGSSTTETSSWYRQQDGCAPELLKSLTRLRRVLDGGDGFAQSDEPCRGIPSLLFPHGQVRL